MSRDLDLQLLYLMLELNNFRILQLKVVPHVLCTHSSKLTVTWHQTDFAKQDKTPAKSV